MNWLSSLAGAVGTGFNAVVDGADKLASNDAVGAYISAQAAAAASGDNGGGGVQSYPPSISVVQPSSDMSAWMLPGLVVGAVVIVAALMAKR